MIVSWPRRIATSGLRSQYTHASTSSPPCMSASASSHPRHSRATPRCHWKASASPPPSTTPAPRPRSRRSSTQWAVPAPSARGGMLSRDTGAPDAGPISDQEGKRCTRLDPASATTSPPRTGQDAGAHRPVVTRRPVSHSRGRIECRDLARRRRSQARNRILLSGRAEVPNPCTQHPEPLVHDRRRARSRLDASACCSPTVPDRGHALYIKAELSSLHRVGLQKQIASRPSDHAGHQVLSATFEREGDTMHAEGSPLQSGPQGREGRISPAGKFPSRAKPQHAGTRRRSPMTTPAPPCRS